MKETEKLGSVKSQKDKIRERYKGIDTDQLDVIPALPQDSFYEDKREKRVAVYGIVISPFKRVRLKDETPHPRPRKWQRKRRCESLTTSSVFSSQYNNITPNLAFQFPFFEKALTKVGLGNSNEAMLIYCNFFFSIFIIRKPSRQYVYIYNS